MELLLSDITAAKKSLTLYIELHLGKYDAINRFYRTHSEQTLDASYNAAEKQREICLLFIRGRLMPELLPYGLAVVNRGIFNKKVDPKARDAYDMLQEIRFQDAWYHTPEGGRSVDFCKPLFSGRYDHPRCSISMDENGTEKMVLTICPQQLDIMIEAAEILYGVCEGSIRDVFAHYTEDAETLELADEMYAVSKSIMAEIYCKKAAESLDMLRKCKENEEKKNG